MDEKKEIKKRGRPKFEEKSSPVMSKWFEDTFPDSTRKTRQNWWYAYHASSVLGNEKRYTKDKYGMMFAPSVMTELGRLGNDDLIKIVANDLRKALDIYPLRVKGQVGTVRDIRLLKTEDNDED